MIKQFFKKLDYRYYIGIFVIGILIVSGAIYILRSPKSAAADWYHPQWSFRQSFTISYTGSEILSEYQVLIDDLDTASLISAGKLQSDCVDLRFTNDKHAILDYSIVGATCNTSATKIWVKTDWIVNGSRIIYMYYGNPTAIPGQNESATFSYNEEKVVGYVLHEMATDLQVISLADNNSISHNSNTLTLNKYQTGAFTSISQWGSITAKNLFNADDNSSSNDLFVPISWAGTEFYFISRDTSTDSYYMIAPWGNATVTIYDDGVDTTCGGTVLTTGTEINCDTSDDGVIRISSDVPILLFVEPAGSDDQMPVHPATEQRWIGGGSQSIVYNGNASLDYRYTYATTSNEDINNSDLTANSSVALSGDDSYGVGGLLVWSANSNYDYGVHQYADGDGGDAHYFNDETEQGTIFGSANQADYISVASTQPATCTVYEIDGTPIDTQTLTSSNTSIYYYGFNTGTSDTYTSGDWYMECDAPVVAHYQKTPSDECNLMHYPMMRQFTYPTPSVGAPAAEEAGPAPVAYWSFDEGYGTTTQDRTSNSNDGTITGATWQTEDQCIAGKCLYFENASDKVAVSGQVIPDLDAITVSMWVKIGPAPASNYPIFFNASGIYLYLAYHHADDRFRLSWNDSGSTQRHLNAYGFEENEWYYITVTLTENSQKLYVDGRLGDEGSYTGFNGSSITGANIGYYATSYQFIGYLDEVKIYPYARTAAQILTDYNAGLAGVSSASGVSVAMGGQSNKSLSDGLVGYWKMDETSWSGVADEVVDASGNGNDGVAGGGVTTASGKFGNGGDFDGDNDYVDLGSISIGNSLNLSGSDVTMSVWFKKNSGGDTYQRIIDKSDGGNGQNGYTIFVDDANGYYLAVNGTPKNIGTLTNDVWHHFVGIIHNDGDGEIWVDGELLSASLDVPNVPSVETNMRIGSWNHSTGREFNGSIDEVRIYNRALSSREVRQLYEWAPGPVAYYDFEENSGTIAYDKSGNENNGTLTNMDASTDWVLGKYGIALDFDGDDDILNGGNNASLQWEGSLTYEAWVKTSDTSNGPYFMWDYYDTHGPFLHIDASGKVAMDGRGKTGLTYYSSGDSTTSVNDNQWHHIVGVWDGSRSTDNLRIYVDGVKENSSDVSDQASTINTGDLSIGRYNEQKFNAQMDEVKIYNYARTPRQILEDYGTGQAQKHPVGYWKFDEGYGTTANDAGIGDNNGTISGASWTNDGKFNKALSFDGNDDYLTATDATSLRQDNDWTITGWIYARSTSAQDKIVIGKKGWHGGIIWYGSNMQFAIFNTTGSKKSINYAPTLSEWYHYTGVYTSNTGDMTFYVNGVSVGTNTFDILTTMNYEAKNTLYVGGSGVVNYNSDVIIDEAKVYNYALSEDEVRQEYNQGKAVVMGSERNSSSTWDDGGFGGNAPVYWFDMEEGTGTAINSKGSSQTTSSAWDGSPTWALGNPGWSLSFDGSSDGVYIPSVSTYAHETLTAWVYIDSSETNGDIVGNCHTNSNAYGFTFYIDNNTLRAKAETNADTYFYTNVTADITNLKNQWIHLGMSWDNLGTGTGGCDATVKLYVNGQLMDSATHNVSAGGYNCTWPYPYPFSIGGTTENSLTRLTKVKVDEVKVYNYVRTPAQIAYDYNGGKPVGWWPLDDAEGISAIDISGNGNDGTLTTMDPANDWLDGTDCKFEGCLDFDGSNDYVKRDISLDNWDNYTEGSVTIWFNWDSGDASTHVCIFRINDDALDTNHFRINLGNSTGTWNDESVRIMYEDAGTYIYNYAYRNGETTYRDSQWHFVAFTVNGSGNKLYFDGEEVSVSQWGESTEGLASTRWLDDIPEIDSVYIGSDWYSSTSQVEFDGKLDDVRIYNYALAPSQIREIYNGGLIRFK